ncbi:MAG: hypothetical protein ACTSR8_11775 [Promethearchaeota archaeon]
MVVSNFTAELEDKAEQNFENIKEAIKGLYNILNITLTEKDDEYYYNAGLDNLKGLYQNLLELMLNDFGARRFMKRLRNSEIEIDIPLTKLMKDII